MNNSQVVTMRRRALLAGMSEYESDSIPNIPGVSADIQHIAEAFTAAEIAVDKILKNVSRTEFLKTTLQFFSSAERTEYLFLYFSGHGLNFNENDYLVPHDAFLEDPRYIDDFLIDINVVGRAMAESEAKEIVFLVDACREGIRLHSKSISIQKFKYKKISVPRSNVQTVFSCRANNYSRVIDVQTGSLFTYSLSMVLKSREYGVGSIDNVLAATDAMMNDVAKRHNLPFQKPYLLRETAPQIAAAIDVFPAGVFVLHEKTRRSSVFSSHPNSDFLWPSFVQLDAYWRRGHFGEGITIYALDEPISAKHLELRTAKLENLVPGDADNGQAPGEADREIRPAESRHGTAVASIVCGKNIGIVPRCTYIGFNVIQNGRGTLSDVLLSLDRFYMMKVHMRRSNEPSVLLIPIGFYLPDITDDHPLRHSLLSIVESTNTLVVAPAGNDPSRGMTFPAAFPFIISVGGVNQSGEIETFSQRQTGPEPEFYGISSVLHADSTGTFSYSPASGTSYAAAYVAGLIALIWSACPTVGSKSLRDRLRNIGLFPKNRSSGSKILIADESLLDTK
jgi:hypothetical protein